MFMGGLVLLDLPLGLRLLYEMGGEGVGGLWMRCSGVKLHLGLVWGFRVNEGCGG